MPERRDDAWPGSAAPDADTRVADPAAFPRSTRRQVLQAVSGVVLAGVIIGWGLPHLADTSWAHIGTHLGRLGWRNGAELFWWVVLGLWTYTFTLTGSLPGLSHPRALVLNVAGSSASNLLPGGGAAGVAATYLILKSWGFRTAAISSSVIVSGVWNIVARLAMPLLGMALLSSGTALPTGVRRGALIGGIIGLGIVAVFVGILISPELTRRLARRLQRAQGQRLNARRARTGRAAVDIEAVLIDQRRRLAAVSAHGWLPMTVGVVGFLGIYFVLFARTMSVVGVHLPVTELFAAYALGRLLTAVGVTPGGLGVTEAGTMAALVFWGADRPAAAAGVLIFAIFTHVLEVPLGALGWLAWWVMPKVPTGRLPAGTFEDDLSS